MAITYPLYMPTVPGFSRIVLKPRNVVGMSSSPFTLQQQTYLFPGEYWELELTLPPMKRAAAEAWITFLLSLRGQSGTFYFQATAFSTPRGVATGTPLVNGAGQTGVSLITDGWTPSTTGILKAGDFLSVYSGSSSINRLYKNLTDVNSDSGGNATFNIWPRLRESPPDNTPVVVNGPNGTFRLAGNQQQIDIDQAQIYGIGFSAVEAI
jgi:hypothetical protein